MYDVNTYTSIKGLNSKSLLLLFRVFFQSMLFNSYWPLGTLKCSTLFSVHQMMAWNFLWFCLFGRVFSQGRTSQLKVRHFSLEVYVFDFETALVWDDFLNITSKPHFDNGNTNLLFKCPAFHVPELDKFLLAIELFLCLQVLRKGRSQPFGGWCGSKIVPWLSCWQTLRNNRRYSRSRRTVWYNGTLISKKYT